jgi:Phage integrase family
VAKGKNVVGLCYDFDRRSATERLIAIEVFAHRTSRVPKLGLWRPAYHRNHCERGLTWDRIDFARSVIALGRQTKSGKGRDVPINSSVYEAFAPLRSAAGGVDATGRVWGAIKDIDAPYRTALSRAKILDPDVTFHTLRHTFASHYVMRGGRLEKLQEILGHSSIKTTEIYKHLAADYLTGATAILEGLGAEINARSTHRPVAASPNVEGDSQMCETVDTEG